MKVKKKWKKYVHQIALACLLFCCITTYVPQTVKAEMQSDQRQSCSDFKYEFDDGKGHKCIYNYSIVGGSAPCYLFVTISEPGNYTTHIISKKEFSVKSLFTADDVKQSEDTKSATLVRLCKHYAPFYVCTVDAGDSCLPNGTYYSMKRDTMENMIKNQPDKYSEVTYCFESELLNNEQVPGYMECHLGDDSKGGINNPIEDADIGCLVISKKKSSDLSGLGDNGNSDYKENLFRVRFGWKYKTNTGFSLQKNKYAQTFIQVRIQNRSVIYKNLRHTEIKRKLNSYGENAIIYNSLPVDHQPLVVTLTDADFLKKYLPKYYAEINTPTNLTNALFLGNNYAFQFRVVCTDDLSVIPGSGGNSKWHCGRWTETSVDFDPVTPTNDEQKTGDIDDNGDFVQNENDTTTKIDDASDKQYDSDDDASDDFNNSSENNKDEFSWNSFKGLINQCKEIPGLIKSVFSFLPDWVLVFVALAFGIWLFVLIKRAIV